MDKKEKKKTIVKLCSGAEHTEMCLMWFNQSFAQMSERARVCRENSTLFAHFLHKLLLLLLHAEKKGTAALK